MAKSPKDIAISAPGPRGARAEVVFFSALVLSTSFEDYS